MFDFKRYAYNVYIPSSRYWYYHLYQYWDDLQVIGKFVFEIGIYRIRRIDRKAQEGEFYSKKKYFALWGHLYNFRGLCKEKGQ